MSLARLLAETIRETGSAIRDIKTALAEPAPTKKPELKLGSNPIRAYDADEDIKP